MQFNSKLKKIFIFLVAILLYKSFVELFIFDYFDILGMRAEVKDLYIKTKIPREELDYFVLGDSSVLFQIDLMTIGGNSFSAAQIGSSGYLSWKYLETLNVKKVKGIIFAQTFIENHYDKDIWKVHIPRKVLSLPDSINILCGYKNKPCSFLDKALFTGRYLLNYFYIDVDVFGTISFGFRSLSYFQPLEIKNAVWMNFRRNRGSLLINNDIPLDDGEFFKPYIESFKSEINPPETEIESIKKIIKFAEDKNINIYWIMPTFYKNQKRLNLDAYMKSYERVFDQLKSERIIKIYPDDFVNSFPREYFVNVNHMNHTGAKAYSRWLSNKIKRIESEELEVR